MQPLDTEWITFVTQNPNIRHDDDQRNQRFLSSPGNYTLTSQVSVTNTSTRARDNHDIPLRVYTSTKTVSTRGVVIFYHSGGFTNGSLDTEDVSSRYMALGGPITVISVGYRLSPAFLYPIPINDGWDAFQSIIEGLPSLVPTATQRANLVISGTSSGGQIAGIVSQRAPYWLHTLGTTPAAARVTLSGVLLRAPVTVRGTDPASIPPQFRDMHKSWSADLETVVLSRLNMRSNHDTLGVPLDARTCPDAYPLWGQFNGMPKTYIQICDVDILRDDAVCYARGLRDVGVEVRESIYKKLPHIFWIYAHSLDCSKKAQEDCVQGLRWLLGITG